MDPAHPETVVDTRETGCCVVGAGPGGMMLSLLLARKGVPVTLLESHRDFDRDFRGDTIHPSTLEALDQIGLADRLLTMPHGQLDAMKFTSGRVQTTVAEFRRLKTRFPYIMILPQARFLEYLAEEAKKFPTFRLEVGATVQRLVDDNGTTRGVQYRDLEGAWHEVRAPLTVGADGRFSKVRSLCGAVPVKSAPPMDILWFRLPRRQHDLRDEVSFFVGGGLFMFLFDRGEEWQVGYAVMKGTFAETKEEGIAALRANLARHIPWLADRVEVLVDWKQVVVLSVESSRVPTWHRPGLLLIGDAAHVMSPVGGVGISYAIQDAIDAANVLTSPLKAGGVTEDHLAEVQRRREPAVRAIQRFQGIVQDRVVRTALDRDRPFRLPWWIRLVLKLPVARDIPAKMIAFGPKQARIEDP